MIARPLSWLLTPFYVAALATGAKSFRDNPIIGNPTLNRMGLHVVRMRLAEVIADRRRRKLARLVGSDDAAALRRDGFVLKQNYLPTPIFEALRQEALSYRVAARDMMQGDAVTRRIALDQETLMHLPHVRCVVENPQWLGLVRYVASSALSPRTYIQTIFSRVRDGTIDPQTHLHADTFHSSVKAWFFLTDVTDDDGPLVYVPGSHRLTKRRLAWERRASIDARHNGVFQAARGSLRIAPAELPRLGLPSPRVFAVPANTLVVADTLGFHARSRSPRPTVRVEIWAYGRRNPYLPWTGLDPVALPFVGARYASRMWSADQVERLGLKKNPWRPAGIVSPETPPSVGIFE
jgi:Phytanoyl-CoA dioxygenase (PhyH)